MSKQRLKIDEADEVPVEPELDTAALRTVETGAWYIVMTDLQSGKRILLKLIKI